VPKIFEALGIQTFSIDSEDQAAPVLAEAANLAFNTEMPVALLLSKRLTGGKMLR
jgi:sulfopyruvate decarboxylase TPP-binding subunit